MNSSHAIDQAAALHRQGQLNDAEALYRRVLEARPDDFDAQHLLGGLLHQRGRHTEGLQLIDAALARHETAEALSNRGVVLQSLRRFDEALASFDRALSLRPDYPDARMNQAMTRLLLGDFARGLPQYEARWQTAAFQPARSFLQPRWQGEDIAGKTILLHSEQGLGDTIQFSRYASLLAARGIDVVLEVQQPLRQILSILPGIRVVARGEPLPPFDVYCPLMSLPFACATTLDTIPPPSALAVPPAYLSKWDPVIGLPQGMRIGLAWAGSAHYRGDRARSMTLAALAPLLARTDVQIIGLQKDVRPQDVPVLRAHPRFININFDDFADTAAVVSRLDLVITVDTAVAHLAAALGKPVWILLPYVPDWRWMLDREDSPWYPTVRLFRQSQPDDWDGVIRRVIAALDELVPVATAAVPQAAERALAEVERELASKPGDPELLNRKGDLLASARRHEAALASYDSALAVRPDYAQALNNRGNSLATLKRFEDALASYDAALRVRPDYALALNNRGNVLGELGRSTEAIESFDRALALAPDNAETLNNRGNSLRDVGRYEEALAAHDRALALAPHYVEAMNNRGNALKELGRFDDALASYERAIAMRPDYAAAHTNLALCRLLVGDFAGGWLEYEWRWKTKPYPALPQFDRPLWLGKEPIGGKTILLVAEQGYGDTIQFSRYAALLARQGARVLLQTQDVMKPLLSGVAGVSQTLDRRDPPSEFDLFCPLMSLPLALGTTLASIPADVPYLAPDADAAAAWGPRLGGGGPRVGLVWSGNPKNKTDRQRSLLLQALAPILAQTRARFFGLQKQLRSDDAEALRRLIPQLTNLDLGDFADTAAALANLDLVITVDTAVAHLAGAMGKPVWILLPAVPDWRWQLGRPDSPWYPTARLFRQERPGDWETVVHRAAAALGEWLGGIAAPRQLSARVAAARDAAPAAGAARSSPSALIDLVQQAVAAHRAGRLDEARRLYEEVLALNPRQFDALHLLGVVHHQHDHHDEALRSINAALDVRQAPEALSNRGSVLHALGRDSEALADFDNALSLRPAYAEAHHNRGLALHGLKRHDDALAAYRQALALKPDYPEAHYNAALVLLEQHRAADARRSLDEAIAARPTYAEALNSRALLQRGQRRYDAALADHDAAIVANPNFAEAYNSRANTRKELGRYQEALADYDRALALKPEHAEAQTNQALLRLLLGQLRLGFAQYEWRWETPDFATARRDFTQPRWRGEEITGKTILLLGEQGLGDTIQFCRYVTDVAARGARVVLEVPPPLVSLMQHLDGAAQVVARGDQPPPFDMYCPLMSMPHVFETDIETIPARIPYLSAPDGHQVDLPPGFRVGLAWSGSAQNRGDRNRSIPFADLAPLTAVPGLTFVTVQKDLRNDDRIALAADPRVVVPALGDFAETAALIEALDLVITVDTAAAHLAGALGKPLWLLLPVAPDWRWLLDRDDSPWYPSARLFRQDRPGDWAPVIRRVADALAALVAVRGEPEAVGRSRFRRR